jgi:aminoglycoside phosphotransferase (APT) family kinase protein
MLNTIRSTMLDHEIDPLMVLEVLGVQEPVLLERVPYGEASVVWRVAVGGRVCALRVLQPSDADTIERELTAMAVARAGGVPVPDVIARGVWRDRPAVLVSWLPGRMLGLELMTHTADLEQLQTLGESLGRTLGAIHSVRAPDALRGNQHSWVKLVGPDEPVLQDRLLALGLRSDALLHMDYHPGNVNVADWRVTGVFDWTKATAGDPRADFARFITLISLAPLGLRPDLFPRSSAGDAMRLRLESAFRRGYSETGKLEGDLSLFYAWAGATTLHSLRAKIGQPGQRVQTHHLEPVRRWTESWKWQAGILP